MVDRSERNARVRTFDVLSIDAIRSSDGSWEWNDAWRQATIEASIDALYSARKLARILRDRELLSEAAKGRIAIEVIEGDPTTIEVQEKSNRRPLFAIRIEWSEIED